MPGTSRLCGSATRRDGYSTAFLFPAVDLGAWHPVASPPAVVIEGAAYGYRANRENSDHPVHSSPPPLPAPLDRSTHRSCRTRATVAVSPDAITVTALTKRTTWHTR
jgi:hypothetical protein